MKAHLHTPVCISVLSMRWTNYVMVNPIQAVDARYVSALRQARGNRRMWATLNHGMFEYANPVELETVHDIMHQIEPDEVVLPDYQRNAMKTCGMSFEWMDRLKTMGYEGTYMLVPQGEDLEEWVWCIKQIIRHRRDKISAIGLPRDLPFDRGFAIKHCLEDFELRNFIEGRRPFHLLGASEPLDKFHIFSDLPVRSINTKWPVLAGMKLMRVQNCNDLPEENGFEFAPINAFTPMPVDEHEIYTMIHENVYIFLATIGEESNYGEK